MRFAQTVGCLLLMSIGSIALAQTPTTAPTTAPAAKVEAIGLQVQKELPQLKDSMPYLGNTGTSLKILISMPASSAGRSIVAMDSDASKLEQFTDDQKTDLTKSAKPSAMGSSWLWPFGNISKDRQSIVVEVRGQRTPVAGASKLILKATLALELGANAKTVEQKDFALKAGSVLPAGAMSMTIKEVSDKNLAPDDKMNVTFTYKGSATAIQSIVFLDPTGQEIKSRQAQTSVMSFGGSQSVETTFGLQKKVDSVTVKMTYFDKIETVKVPVALQVGVGL